MKNIKRTQAGVIYNNKVQGLHKKFCITLYTTVKTNTIFLQFFLWLISNVPLAIAELRCVLWVPRSLNGYHQPVRKEVCSDFLPRYENDGESLLSRTVTKQGESRSQFWGGGMHKERFWYICHVVKQLTQTCTFQLLKSCRSVSEGLDLTEMLQLRSFSCTVREHTEV
jgi:hypothetical protein